VSIKAQNKRNALKHGAYSRMAILPGEKLADFEALRQEYYDEWMPDGVTEEHLVDDICALRWKKRRLDQYDQIKLRRTVERFHSANENTKDLDRLKNIWGPEFSKITNIEDTDKLLAELSPDYAGAIIEWVPREKCEDLSKWGQQIGAYLSNLKVPDLVEGPDLFVALLNPDSMEMEILRSERIDEAIDRKIKRLMQVKTAKQIFPNMRKKAEPSLIDARPLPAISQLKPVTQMKSTVSARATDGDATRQPITQAEPARRPTSEVDSSAAVPQVEIAQGTVSTPEAPVAKKEHLKTMPVKVEFFAKPAPQKLEEIEEFSQWCIDLTERGALPRSPF
jgi:hypothetical protein